MLFADAESNTTTGVIVAAILGPAVAYLWALVREKNLKNEALKEQIEALKDERKNHLNVIENKIDANTAKTVQGTETLNQGITQVREENHKAAEITAAKVIESNKEIAQAVLAAAATKKADDDKRADDCPPEPFH